MSIASLKRRIARVEARYKQHQQSQYEVLSTLSTNTRQIDPTTASLQDIESAMLDCSNYWAVVYPEIENDLVEWIEARCTQAIEERYSRHGTTILSTIKQRCGII